MGNKCNFQDSMGLGILKISSKKWPSIVLELFKSDYFERRYGEILLFSTQQRAVVTQHVHLKKDPPLSWNFSYLSTLREDKGQKLHFEYNIGLWVLKMFI